MTPSRFADDFGMGYPVPTDELARLRTLAGFDLLDTALDPAFDDIVQMAAIVCRVPIAVVSFFTADQQILRSRVGMDTPTTSRDIAFCAHSISQRDLFVVPDAVNDDRFRNYPTVTGDPYIRFYAGMPIISPRGDCVLGTVCVIDREPRMPTLEQCRALGILARQVSAHLYGPICEGAFHRAS
jgi:GAF domain-containing protein